MASLPVLSREVYNILVVSNSVSHVSNADVEHDDHVPGSGHPAW